MKSVVFFQPELPIELYTGADELVLAVKDHSRRGNLTVSEYKKWALLLKEKGFFLSLEWDYLFTESELFPSLDILKELILFADSVRVKDTGVIYHLLHHSKIPLDLLLDRGHHNTPSHLAWSELLKDRLRRVILSSELPKQRIFEMGNQTKLCYELFCFGPLPISYSPRKLLSAQFKEVKGVALASSLESAHKNFLVTENLKETFIYHFRNFSLLDRFEVVRELPLGAVSLDFTFENGESLLPLVLSFIKAPSSERLEEIKKGSKRQTFQGFFSVNKTDKQFANLKNRHIQERGGRYLGEVLELVRESHTVLLLRNPDRELRIGDQLICINPEGREVEVGVTTMKSPFGRELDVARQGDLVLIKPVKGASVRSAVYFKD